MKKTLFSVAVIAAIFGGCATSGYMQNGSKVKDAEPITMGIDHTDFEKAASDAVESLLSSGSLERPGGGRYVVAMGKVINDTTQRIDTALLTKKIRIAMLKSGKAVITTAVAAGGAEDTMSHDVRELRENDEFAQNTIAKKGTLLAPDMSLSGKIIQRNIKTTDNKQLVEYYFQLTLTQLQTGLAFWEDEININKIGSNKSVSW